MTKLPPGFVRERNTRQLVIGSTISEEIIVPMILQKGSGEMEKPNKIIWSCPRWHEECCVRKKVLEKQ
jgi:hypothetical protein